MDEQKADWYDPVINNTYHGMELYYYIGWSKSNTLLNIFKIVS